MNKINYNENKVLRSCILVQTLEKIGYNEEIPTITNYFLKYNVFDTENIEELTQSTMFESENYIDNLSSILTEKFKIGYPLFIDCESMFEVLLNYYNIKELNICSLLGIHKLFALLTTTQLIELIDFEKAKTILSKDLKYILINMSVKQLNKFMKDYLSYYLNENISTDIIFEYNNFYYICFDYCNNKGEYTQITINEVKEFIIDFVNSIEEIEDYELIYEVILKGD